MTRILLLLLPLAACATDGKDSGDGPGDTAATDCSTDSYWNGGNEESPDMNPGEDCIACHSRGEGPEFTLAGTVMGAYADLDDCNGIQGVTVRVTDADGVVTELATTEAGNFYTRADIAMPYTIELEKDGQTSRMVSAQSDGACASCHTADGAGGAPGRVVAP